MAGAAAVIKSHVAKCGTKGNTTPRTRTSRKEADAATRVGGTAGANFSNHLR